MCPLYCTIKGICYENVSAQGLAWEGVQVQGGFGPRHQRQRQEKQLCDLMYTLVVYIVVVRILVGKAGILFKAALGVTARLQRRDLELFGMGWGNFAVVLAFTSGRLLG